MSTASARSEIPAATVVPHVGRQFRASEKVVAEAALGSHPGVVSVEANPVAQTATVRYDPALTSVQELRRVAERSGFECAGCNTPGCTRDSRCCPQRMRTTRDTSCRDHPGRDGQQLTYDVIVTGLGTAGPGKQADA